MTRSLTFICVLLASASGLYLYQSKHQAQMLDREIAHTLKATDVARDRIGVLRGEWALLNEPERLAALSQAHLGLKTLAPSQFATAAELGAPPAAARAARHRDGHGRRHGLGSDGGAIAPIHPDRVGGLRPSRPRLPARTSSSQSSHQRRKISLRSRRRIPPPGPLRPGLPSVMRTQRRHGHRCSSRPPLPMPLAPLPVPKPAAMHSVLAPVVNVSVSPIAAPPQPRIVQARPAPARAAASGPSAAAPPRTAMPAPEGASISTASAPPSYVRPSYNPPSASALGGSRPLLPPPVPFGSAPLGSTMAASSMNPR